MKKDRSSSGGTLEFPTSPYVSRRSHKEKQPSYSRLRLNPNAAMSAQIVELTTFHIPGLDVKVGSWIRIVSGNKTEGRRNGNVFCLGSLRVENLIGRQFIAVLYGRLERYVDT